MNKRKKIFGTYIILLVSLCFFSWFSTLFIFSHKEKLRVLKVKKNLSVEYGIPNYQHLKEDVSFSIRDAIQFASYEDGIIKIYDRDCNQPLYRTKTQGWGKTLPSNDEEYVYVKCGEKINLLVRTAVDKALSKSASLTAEKFPNLALQNIVIITLDALSRAKFAQTMPKTIKFIEQLQSHQLFEFPRSQVVDYNSPPNKVAFFTGRKLKDIENITRLADNKRQAEVEQIKFLEDWAKERGFISAEAITDCTGWNRGDWSTFYEGYIAHQYGKLKNQYADLVFPQAAICETSYDYMRLVGRNVSDNIFPTCSQNFTYEKGLFRVGNNYTIHGMYRCEDQFFCCVGHKSVWKHVQDWALQVMDTYDSNRKYMHLTFMEPHHFTFHFEDFDTDMELFLRELVRKPKTMIVIWSDHGAHYGKQYESFAGFIHHKLTVLNMLLPNEIVEANPCVAKNLKNNEYALISHYDVYHTLVQLMSLGYDDECPQEERVVTTDSEIAPVYGSSLLVPLPRNRTCENAGVEPFYCHMHWRDGCPNFDYRLSLLTILTEMEFKLKSEIPGTREICQSFDSLTPKALGCFYSPKLQLYYLDFTFLEYSAPSEYFSRGVRYRALLTWSFQLLHVAQISHFGPEFELCSGQYMEKYGDRSDFTLQWKTLCLCHNKL